MSNLEPGTPLPDSLEAKCDLLGTVQEVRREVEKSVRNLKAREKELSDAILTGMESHETRERAGMNFRVTWTQTEVPTARDWDAVHEHIRATGDFAMLQKRLAVTHIRALDETPPGVSMLSINKLTTKRI